MTRLMTWFIELQNRFNESRLFKISTIYVLNQVDDLTSWQVHTVWDCEIKYVIFMLSLNVVEMFN